jgi:hypothetical protein
LAHSGKVEERSEEEDRRPRPGNKPKSHGKQMKIRPRVQLGYKYFTVFVGNRVN